MTALALLVALAQDPAEQQAVKRLETYFAAMRKAEFEAAAECIHPRSLTKMRKTLLAGAEERPEEERERLAAFWGFASWKSLAASSDRMFFVHFLRNMGKLGGNVQEMVTKAEARVVAAVRRDQRIYAVIELTYQDEKGPQVLETLYVLYQHGDRWLLANPSETNIGK